MGIASDLPVLWRLLRGRPTGPSHAASLEAFYGPQAEAYDRFRERLLHGRSEAVAGLLRRLPSTGGTLVELGAGTGRNLEFAGPRLAAFDRVYAVDLCPSLLAVAARRFAANGWGNTVAVEADATTWRPPAQADGVLFSYSLSMIPDWRAALANGVELLRPGGWLALVDFQVPERAGWLDRRFLPWWFRHDGVHLRPGLLTAMAERLVEVHTEAGRGSMPYLPIRAPYVIAIGRRPG